METLAGDSNFGLAMRGIVKVAIVVCSTVLAMAGKLPSDAITAIYTATLAVTPIDTLAHNIPATRIRTKEIEKNGVGGG